MSVLTSNETSHDFEKSDIQAGPATTLSIGGSGNTDTPINTGCDIRTNSDVLDANGNLIQDGIVAWTISTNPYQPGITVHRTSSRDNVVLGIVKESFSLTYTATYNNLRESKTIAVKATSDPKIFLLSPPHDQNYRAGETLTLRVSSSGILPTDAPFYTVRYIRPGGPTLGIGTQLPYFEFTTLADKNYTGLNTVFATLHDSRTNKESSLITINFTVE